MFKVMNEKLLRLNPWNTNKISDFLMSMKIRSKHQNDPYVKIVLKSFEVQINDGQSRYSFREDQYQEFGHFRE